MDEVDRDLAQASAAIWWEGRNDQEAACDRCGASIRRPEGFLCAPALVGVSLGEALVDTSRAPDLLCQKCFKPGTHQPFLVTGGGCWFCTKGTARKSTAKKAKLYRQINGWWRTLTLDVPRCPNCERVQFWDNVLVALIFVAGSPFGVPAGIWLWGRAQGWWEITWLSWVVGIAGGFFLTMICGGLVVFPIAYLLGVPGGPFQSEALGIKQGVSEDDFPLIKALKKIGWQADKPV